MVSVCLRRHGYGTQCLVIVGAEIILAPQLDVRFGSSWQTYILHWITEPLKLCDFKFVYRLLNLLFDIVSNKLSADICS